MLTKNKITKEAYDSSESLLYFFPKSYQKYELTSLSKDNDNTQVTVIGNIVENLKLKRRSGRIKIFNFIIKVDNLLVTCILFNQDYLRNQFTHNRQVLIKGKYNHFKLELTVNKVIYLHLEDYLGYYPIYDLPKKFNNRLYHNEILELLKYYIDNNKITRLLPSEIEKKNNLISKANALEQIHNPKNLDSLNEARRYFKYEEFFIYHLSQQSLKNKEKNVESKLLINLDELDKLHSKLPFTLTNSQTQAISEIVADLESPSNMYRVLQGDVGSGKSVVALSIAYLVALNKHQSVVMAPTEILATQLYNVFKMYLSFFNINVKLLISNRKKSDKERLKNEIKNNEVSVVIGTHALIEDDVVFSDLRVAIIDEQHRFGVLQRRLLIEKNKFVNTLLMSATPIPRTYAMMVYGDLEVSHISIPIDRKRNVVSKVIISHEDNAIDRILLEEKEYHQAFIICPLIEDSEYFDDLESILSTYEKLSKNLPNYRFGILHSKIKVEEKNKILEQFENKEIDYLISTTVVEVGIDLKNISLMIVIDSERFGLAQLHQLRGRIGRSGQVAKFIMLSGSTTKEVYDRLNFLAKNDDGMLISEYDLRSRGPGEFIGYQQSGKHQFKFSDPKSDYEILLKAKEDAYQYFDKFSDESQNIILKLTDKSIY